MYRRLLGLAALILATAALSGPARAQKGDEKKETPAPPAALPADAIFVLTDSTAKALEAVPNVYVLTADRFHALQEELARLRKFAERASQPPTQLTLKGKVDGNLVLLTAEYGFDTDAPDAVVRLGGSPAQAVGVSLGGKTPRLQAGENGKGAKGRDEGFSVLIDRPSGKPEGYQLTLELVLPLAARGTGQGFSLELPRAAITRLEFDLPAGSRDVRLGGKPLNGSVVKLTGNQLSAPLGAIDRLELEWKSAQAASAAAVLAADGIVHVRLDRQKMTTTARLTLRAQSGQTKRWRLAVPANAELSFPDADNARVERVEVPDKKQPGLRTLHLKEATADPLTVVVTSSAAAPQPGAGKAAVGPFNVLGAVEQRGSVLVSSAVADWHVEPTPRGDLTRRAATEEEGRADPALAAAFRYGPGGGDRQAALPWLEVEVEGVRGQVRARPSYVVALAPAGLDERPDALRWKVETTLTVTPRRAAIDRFAITLPPGGELDLNSIAVPDRVRNFHHDEANRLLEFRLNPADAEAVAPVTVKFEVAYPPLPAEAARAVVALPRPNGMVEQDGTVRVLGTPRIELLSPPPERTPGLELTRQAAHELTYRCARVAPDRVETQWRPYRPIVVVDSLIDLTLGAGQAQVRQELRYQLPPDSPARLTLRVPEAVAGLRVKKGGQLNALAGGTVALAPAAGGQPVVELEYICTLPANAGDAVPLVRPDGDCRGQTRLRVWSEAGALPAVPEGWLEQNLEEVPGRDRLPVLVLRSPRLDQPLVLRVAPGGEGDPRVLIERALIGVAVDADGGQKYTARYRLGRLAGRHIDLELPAPADSAAVQFEAHLGERKIDHEILATESPGKAGRLVRLRLAPQLVRHSSVLELTYQLTPDRVARTPVTTVLLPPRPLGEVGQVPTRWQVRVPPGWVVLGPEPGAGATPAWSWQRWLWVPRPRASDADLEAWFTGDEARPGGADFPTLTLWRGSEPLRLTHAPRQAWLIGCSLLAVLVGLGLTRLALSPRPGRSAWAWALAALLLVAALALVVLAPVLAAQVAYGCQLGVAVLVLLVLIQWLLHERYRRQVIFLPSFTRARADSSPGRHEARQPGEQPSTVDAPRPLGSSVERGT